MIQILYSHFLSFLCVAAIKSKLCSLLMENQLSNSSCKHLPLYIHTTHVYLTFFGFGFVLVSETGIQNEQKYTKSSILSWQINGRLPLYSCVCFFRQTSAMVRFDISTILVLSLHGWQVNMDSVETFSLIYFLSIIYSIYNLKRVLSSFTRKTQITMRKGWEHSGVESHFEEYVQQVQILFLGFQSKIHSDVTWQ